MVYDWLRRWYSLFFFNDTATTEIYTLSLHDALPISGSVVVRTEMQNDPTPAAMSQSISMMPQLLRSSGETSTRSEEHTSELQSRQYLVCRLLLEKKKNIHYITLLSLLHVISSYSTSY